MVSIVRRFMDNTHAIDHTMLGGFSYTLPWNKLTWACWTSIEFIQIKKYKRKERKIDQGDHGWINVESWTL